MPLPPKVVAQFLEAQLHLGQVALDEARGGMIAVLNCVFYIYVYVIVHVYVDVYVDVYVEIYFCTNDLYTGFETSCLFIFSFEMSLKRHVGTVPALSLGRPVVAAPGAQCGAQQTTQRAALAASPHLFGEVGWEEGAP